MKTSNKIFASTIGLIFLFILCLLASLRLFYADAAGKGSLQQFMRLNISYTDGKWFIHYNSQAK